MLLFYASIVSILFCGYSVNAYSIETTIEMGNAKTANTKVVGISQIVEHPALNAVREGILAALKEQGFEPGKNLAVDYENAQGNMVIATQIASKLLSSSASVIVGISTPSAQTVYLAAQRNGKRIPIVFAAVSDPIAAKLEPGDTQYPITGITDKPNLEGLLEVMQKMLPHLKTIGVIYSSAEANSVATVKRFKQLIIDKKLDATLKIQEVTVNSTSDVAQAMQSLVNKVDAIYFPQDNTIVSAIETVVNVAAQNPAKQIPLFCSDPLLVNRGILAAVGYNYADIGRETGLVVARILKGEAAETIPIRSPEHLETAINKKLAQKLGLKIPEKLQFSEMSPTSSAKTASIGIILPIEHAALKEIVAGFEKSLRQNYHQPVIFKLQNAHGDLKLQRNIIDLYIGQKVDIFVPVGTPATRMTLSLVKKHPIVSLAAQFTEADRLKRNPRNITGVLDEIGAKKKLEMLTQVIPNLKKLTVIFHSGNEKNFDEYKELEKYSEKAGIKLQQLLIQNLPELETVAKGVSQDSQAILVFKDHLVASGIRLLVPIAESKGIPLVSSDEGTVLEGAAFALGVTERAIGEEGGKLAAQVLQGTAIETMPIQTLQKLTLFYNPAALTKQKVELSKLKSFATHNHYELLPLKMASKK